MRFIPLAELEAQGYGAYLDAFDEAKEGARCLKFLKWRSSLGVFLGNGRSLPRKLPGVLSTRVGYTRRTTIRITAIIRACGGAGVALRSEAIGYEALLAFFFQIHDPTTLNRQGNDVGTSYRSEIFYTSEAQRELALRMIDAVNASGRWPGPVVTPVTPAAPFWEAEPEHQDYLLCFPNGYTCHYPRAEWVLPSEA